MHDRASLADVAGLVAAHLRTEGIRVVVVGGSAITLHAGDVYTSHDIDFAVLSGHTLRELAAALAEIGFFRKGREYISTHSEYSVDIVAGIPLIDNEPIEEYTLIETASGPVQTYYLEDAISDRVAAFVHWSDSQSLDVAERAIGAARTTIDPPRLERAFARLKPAGADAHLRLQLARQRIETARPSTGSG